MIRLNFRTFCKAKYTLHVGIWLESFRGLCHVVKGFHRAMKEMGNVELQMRLDASCAEGKLIVQIKVLFAFPAILRELII